MPPQSSDEEREWLAKIELSKFYTNHIGNQGKRWDKYRDALASDFGNGDDDNALDVNMVHGTTQLNLSPLHTSDVHITIRATRPTITIGSEEVDNVERARYTEAEINYWIKELKVRTEVVRRVVHDAEVTNHGYAFVGIYTDAQKHLMEKQPDEDTDARPRRLEWNPLIKTGQPFCTRHPPKQVLMPPGHVSFNEHPYMIMGWRKPKWVVEAMFPKAELSELEPSVDVWSREEIEASEANPELKEYLSEEKSKLVQLWQIWSQEHQKVMVYAEGWPTMLEKEDWPWVTEGFPVNHLYFVDIPDEYWGAPPMGMYWPQQRELNWARTASKTRNNMIKQSFAIRKSETSGAIAAQWREAGDGTVLEIPGDDDRPVAQDIVPLPTLPAPSEAYADGQVQISDILMITGHGPQGRGRGDPNIDSATESANVDKWSLIRSTDRGDRVKSLYLDISKGVWFCVRGTSNKKRDRRVLGELGAAAVTLNYSLNDLLGEFAWSMDVGSLMGDNPVRRQQMALGNYNLLRQDPLTDPQHLILDLFDSQGKADPASYLANRDPQAELAEMAQGFPVEAIMRDDHMTHIPQHMQQEEQLTEAIAQIPDEELEDARGLQLRMALHLVMAHRAQHMKFVEQITGKPMGGEPGEPTDPNQLRQDLGSQAAGGSETDAELSGQPQGGNQGRGGLIRQVS